MKKLFTLLTLALISIGSAWADDAIFSMTAVTNAETSVAVGATETITATFNSGSAAAVYNGHASKAQKMLDGKGLVNLGGSGACYFHASFTTALAEGDVITSSTENTFYISNTSTKGSSVTFPYTIKSTDTGLIGATDLYVWKNSGSSFKSFTITRITGTAAPQISMTGNTVTLTCATNDATIYYTTDGSEPSTSSDTYSDPFVLDNSCTVRAFAKKDDDASGIVKKDCYVTHALAIAKLGYSGGTVAGDVWTSEDENYVLTNNVAGRGINYVDLATSKDGFKLNHTDNYTLQPSTNIKITKIVVVGKSWLTGSAGNASTISIDGFTPASGAFFDYLEGGETYVNSIEFTPSSELDFGDAVIIRPGNNQLGAYIEVYGEELVKSQEFDYSTADGKSNYASWTIALATVATNSTGVDGSNNFLKGDDLTATISAADDYVITKVIFTYTGSDRVSATTTANDGTAVTTSGATQLWKNDEGKESG